MVARRTTALRAGRKGVGMPVSPARWLPAVSELQQAGWTEEDLERYRAAGDVAAAIKSAAEDLESKNRRVGPRAAAEALYAQYGTLFADEDGTALAVAKAREREPGLFALHMAVRETYTRILKNHGKDRQEHGAERARWHSGR